MKKLFLGFAVTAGALLSAQQTSGPAGKGPVRFGIKAGANAASFNEQKFSTNVMKLGLYGGVYADFPISKLFSFQPEVLYSQMGAESVDIEKTEVDENIKGSKVSLNYISVPLMLQIRPGKRFYIEAGPEFSYFLNGKSEGEKTVTTVVNGVTVTNSESFSENIQNDDINKFNVGLGLGLGYYFSDHLGINARYVNSLTDIGKDRVDGQSIVTNRVFQLGLNYKF